MKGEAPGSGALIRLPQIAIYEAVHAVSCVLTPSVIKQNGGGGANCVFANGP